ncbi:myrosinase 1-like [Colias croceus]|uniref:myrosinase 1-like n=1 Tax=Colias crocea TaxID=72248 RepID=UPI001E2809BA|nr:myrosinase 1-like [Colias croceus]
MDPTGVITIIGLAWRGLICENLLSAIQADILKNVARNVTQKSLRKFPDDFLFGAATSSYQIEGAWNDGGKGWSMWDHLVRTDPDHIIDGTNGDVAANSYYFYEKDIAILKELGANVYRFSVSWPRILPFGRADYINPEGIAYYNTLIDRLLANNITPFLTIYHWELPQNLNEQGGWLTEDIVDWFGDYARVLFQNFGDRVKHWLTINEPSVHCNLGYAIGLHAPRIKSPGVKYYECGRHILLAHARAYHIYKNEFAHQGGKIGLALDSEMSMPSSNSPEDIQATEDCMMFHLGQFAHPIYSETGNYPQRFIDLIAEASARQGLPESRLRSFSQEQIDYIRGTGDFLSINHYSSNYVYRNASVVNMHEVPSLLDDAQLAFYKDPSWPSSFWIATYGPGLHKLLVYIKNNYNNPIIYITENGFASTTGLNDEGRVSYFREYLTAVLDAIDDGVNVKLYCAWSLMDNFEWTFGYSIRFGLYEIDENDPEKTRRPRKSALVFKEIVRTRTIDMDYNPDPYASSAINKKTSIVLLAAISLIKTVF